MSSPQGSLSKPPGPRVDLKSLPLAHKIIGIAAVVSAIAAFLPWASAFGISVTGVGGGDGVITLIAAIVGLALLASYVGLGPVRVGHKVFAGVEIALGVIVALIGIIDLSSFAAFGIYLTLLAGIALAIGGVLAFRGTGTTASPDPN